MNLHPEWLVPDWPAPPHVHAFATTRAGGVSSGEYGSMNLGLSSGDDAARVAANRERLRAALPGDPTWLVQVHGRDVADLDRWTGPDRPRADAALTRERGRVAGVLTADCLPVAFCDRAGTCVAVAHAGWRGLAAGVLESTIEAMYRRPGDILAWMGPAIGPQSFEVGPEVLEAFLAGDPGAGEAFRDHGPGKHLADLYALARRRLARAGVGYVGGGGSCTMREAHRFFSYRRCRESGRMGTFAWIA